MKRSHGVVVGAALVLAGLGGATSAGLAARTTTSAHRVSVVEREYRITPATRSLGVGLTTFVVHNRGKVAHEFEVRGPGIAGKRIAGKLNPGATKTLTVTLRKGRYTLLCPIHAALGMKTTVSAGGAATTPGTTTSSTTTTQAGWG